MTIRITDKHGETYEVSRREIGPSLLAYHVARDGLPIARAVLNTHRGCIQDAVIYATADRRRGIATALYDAIERDQNLRLVPNHRRLADGKAFWRTRSGKSSRKALGSFAPRHA